MTTTAISPRKVIARTETAPAGPAGYAQAAAAKLKRDRLSFAEFRAADQREHERLHERRVTGAVKAAESEVQLWRGDLEAVEEDAAEKLAALRALEDKARAAAEYARLQREAFERVKGLAETPPEEETELSLRSSAADETAFNARKAADEAGAESQGADRDLAEAREALTSAERQLESARKAAGVPAGTARISDVTMKACAGYLMTDEAWDSLSPQDRQRVHFLAQPRDVVSVAEFLRSIAEYGGGA